MLFWTLSLIYLTGLLATFYLFEEQRLDDLLKDEEPLALWLIVAIAVLWPAAIYFGICGMAVESLWQRWRDR